MVLIDYLQPADQFSQGGHVQLRGVRGAVPATERSTSAANGPEGQPSTTSAYDWMSLRYVSQTIVGSPLARSSPGRVVITEPDVEDGVEHAGHRLRRPDRTDRRRGRRLAPYRRSVAKGEEEEGLLEVVDGVIGVSRDSGELITSHRLSVRVGAAHSGSRRPGAPSRRPAWRPGSRRPRHPPRRCGPTRCGAPGHIRQ